MKSLFWRIGVIATSIALVCCLFGCSDSKLEQADELYEQGSYSEALEIYESLGSQVDEETQEKIKDCNFWLFIDYVRSHGKIKTSHTVDGSSTMTDTVIEARESGEIIVSYEQWDTPSGTWTNTQYTFSIPYKASEAEVTGYCKISNSGAIAEQKASGVLDLGTYKQGDNVKLEITSDDARSRSGLINTSLGLDMFAYNSSIFEIMITDLQTAISDSGVDLTIEALGFKKMA